MKKEKLKIKYQNQYCREMDNFDFDAHLVNWEVLKDFSGWKHIAMTEEVDDIIIFYQD